MASSISDTSAASPDATPDVIATSALDRLSRNRNQQFWLLQLIGWTGWGVGGALSWAYWDADEIDLWLFLPSAVLGVLVSSGLRYAYRWIWDAPPLPRIVAIVTSSYVAAGIWQATKNGMQIHIYHKYNIGYFEGILLASFYPMLCWSGLYFGIKYYQMLQEETAKVLRVSAMAHQAQLKMLRYQLNPHFLFNTLNAISTLILDADTTTANKMVTRLSSFLRYSLDSDPMQKVTLDQELNALKLYLDIEKVRFDERLSLELAVEEPAGSALIPSLILQPLVENAIKYAIAQSESGGTIRLTARVFAQDLLLELADDGPGIVDPDLVDPDLVDPDLVDPGATPSKRGVGLTNTRNRLQEAYGSNHAFKLENVVPHGLKICIRVPFETT